MVLMLNTVVIEINGFKEAKPKPGGDSLLRTKSVQRRAAFYIRLTYSLHYLFCVAQHGRQQPSHCSSSGRLR